MAQGFNEYDTFTYEKAPDYTKSFDEAANINAWAGATAQEKANAETRMANAKQGIANFNAASKLSLTLAEQWKKHTEKRDNRLMNEAYQLHLEAGITQKKLQDYNNRNKDKEGYLKDVGLYNELAAEARARGDNDLADRLEEVTGHKLLMAKQSLLRTSAINWRANWERDRENYSLTREDGTTLTYGNIKNRAEYNLLVREHNIAMGFTDVNWASPEFIDQEFRKTMEREQANAVYEWQSQKNKTREFERKETWKEQLRSAAGTDQLGQTVYDLMTTQYGFSTNGTAQSMREDIATLLANEVDVFIATNGRQGIDPMSLSSLDSFMIDHRGSKEKVSLGKTFKEFNHERGGFLYQKILDAQVKRVNAIDSEKTIKQVNYMNALNQKVEEHGLPTKEERAALILQFRSDPNNVGIPVPQGLLNYYTVEDQEDDEMIAEIEAKISKGIKIQTRDWANIQDKTKRDQYKEIASGPAGSGIDASSAASRDTALPRAVATHLSEIGLPGIKSKEYGIMLAQAEAQYNSLYMRYAREERFESLDDLHNYVIQEVERRIEKGQISGVRDDPKDPRTFTRELTSGRKFITEGVDNNIKVTDLLSSEQIPGSEAQFKRLEAYAANPNGREIPYYYIRLARDIKGVNGEELAAMQYLAVTGKELPKSKKQTALEKESPIVRFFATTYPSYSSITRAKKMSNGHDFNSNESLIEGVK